MGGGEGRWSVSYLNTVRMAARFVREYSTFHRRTNRWKQTSTYNTFDFVHDATELVIASLLSHAFSLRIPSSNSDDNIDDKKQ